jgi:hypothetical protein
MTVQRFKGNATRRNAGLGRAIARTVRLDGDSRRARAHRKRAPLSEAPGQGARTDLDHNPLSSSKSAADEHDPVLTAVAEALDGAGDTLTLLLKYRSGWTGLENEELIAAGLDVEVANLRAKIDSDLNGTAWPVEPPFFDNLRDLLTCGNEPPPWALR